MNPDPENSDPNLLTIEPWGAHLGAAVARNGTEEAHIGALEGL